MKNQLVKEWMSTNLLFVEPDTKLPEAHRMMKNHGVRRLPVIKKKGDRAILKGIVTLGDIRGAEPSNATSLSIWEINYLIAKIEVREMMSRDVITIRENQTISEAANLMMEKKISGLPVVDNQDNLVGMITESDIFRMVVTYGWEAPVAV